jgi:hypothetical protein
MEEAIATDSSVGVGVCAQAVRYRRIATGYECVLFLRKKESILLF